MHDTSNFSNNCLQTDYFTSHCITIPVDQKFTYAKLTVPLYSLENSRKLCHGFRSFWFTYLSQLEVYPGCISRPTFKLSASLLDIMGKSKEFSQDLRIFFIDLHKSYSSLGEISKRLKVPRSSVQTIVRKYKHHGTTQPSYRPGRRRILSPRD